MEIRIRKRTDPDLPSPRCRHEVESGLLEEEAQKLNEGFSHWIAARNRS